jgi:hypothetical protein
MTTVTISSLPAGRYLKEVHREINAAAEGSGVQLVLHDDGAGNLSLLDDIVLDPGEIAEFVWNGSAWLSLSGGGAEDLQWTEFANVMWTLENPLRYARRAQLLYLKGIARTGGDATSIIGSISTAADRPSVDRYLPAQCYNLGGSAYVPGGVLLNTSGELYMRSDLTTNAWVALDGIVVPL